MIRSTHLPEIHLLFRNGQHFQRAVIADFTGLFPVLAPLIWRNIFRTTDLLFRLLIHLTPHRLKGGRGVFGLNSPPFVSVVVSSYIAQAFWPRFRTLRYPHAFPQLQRHVAPNNSYSASFVLRLFLLRRILRSNELGHDHILDLNPCLGTERLNDFLNVVTSAQRFHFVRIPPDVHSLTSQVDGFPHSIPYRIRYGITRPSGQIGNFIAYPEFKEQKTRSFCRVPLSSTLNLFFLCTLVAQRKLSLKNEDQNYIQDHQFFP